MAANNDLCGPIPAIALFLDVVILDLSNNTKMRENRMIDDEIVSWNSDRPAAAFNANYPKNSVCYT